METELYLNTPTYEKDKEYTECEYCCGDGWVNSTGLDSGNESNEIFTCPRCHRLQFLSCF